MENSDFQWIRLTCLTKTYFWSSIVDVIKVKYSIPQKFYGSLDHLVLWINKEINSNEVKKIISQDDNNINDPYIKFLWLCQKISQLLNFNEFGIREAIISGVVRDKVYKSDIIHHAPIFLSGTYIKVDVNTKQQDVLTSFKEAKEFQKTLEDIKKEKNLPKNYTIIKARKRTDLTKEDEHFIDYFIKIEDNIKIIANEKKRKTELDDYNGWLVIPAIERLVGDELGKKNLTDSEFDNLLKKGIETTRTHYYAFLKRLELPTPTQYKKLLRLVLK